MSLLLFSSLIPEDGSCMLHRNNDTYQAPSRRHVTQSTGIFSAAIISNFTWGGAYFAFVAPGLMTRWGRENVFAP